jgi:3-deoxy-D-manno-octulosonate 8-phosphate phosphatase (KDO 8-P phosphatase)
MKTMTNPEDFRSRATRIRLLLTDVDGVLTDGGVYYGDTGEVMKRFNIRDGMAVERLRAVGVDVGIITGERSKSVVRRAEKLGIQILHLYCKDKPAALRLICEQEDYTPDEIAYIGDDVNDVDVMGLVALAAAPGDALPQAMAVAHYVCRLFGGQGAFREFAELIIAAKGPGTNDKEQLEEAEETGKDENQQR